MRTHTLISLFFLMILALCTTEPYASDLCSESKHYSHAAITSRADITVDGGKSLRPGEKDLVPLRPGLKKGSFGYFFRVLGI